MGEPDTTIRAAGAVLWRDGPAGQEVALIHRPRYDDWTLPKGKLKNGEHVLRAAVREVREETGTRPILGRRMSPQRYLKDGRPKQVEWWSAVPAEDPLFVPGDEVDRLEWLPVDAAVARLTWNRDLPVLRDFATGPVGTTPLILLRHASAGSKQEWPHGDELRPLDDPGRAVATGLADLLGSYGTARVVTSATARCVETVLPYVRRTGSDVRVEEAFTVRSYADKGRARARLLALVDDDVPTVICTHGELVADLADTACDRLGTPPPSDPSLRKGAFWALHTASGTLAAMESHTP
jgi:8-oxo-dGTP diphosphatase